MLKIRDVAKIINEEEEMSPTVVGGVGGHHHGRIPQATPRSYT
jgi:hypothetical protein